MEKDKFKIAFTETILNTFPEILKQDVEKVIEILSFDKDYLFSPDSQTIYIDNEIINIPCRIYIDEPDPVKEKSLTEQQKIMLNCLFLRHHNGYIRQSRLELLIDKTKNSKTEAEKIFKVSKHNVHKLRKLSDSREIPRNIFYSDEIFPLI